jgi:hypothetical protein
MYVVDWLMSGLNLLFCVLSDIAIEIYTFYELKKQKARNRIESTYYIFVMHINYIYKIVDNNTIAKCDRRWTTYTIIL